MSAFQMLTRSFLEDGERLQVRLVVDDRLLALARLNIDPLQLVVARIHQVQVLLVNCDGLRKRNRSFRFAQQSMLVIAIRVHDADLKCTTSITNRSKLTCKLIKNTCSFQTLTVEGYSVL